VVVVVCLSLTAYSFIFLKSFLLLFVFFFRSYSFLFAVLWWPVQWAFVAFLVTLNKYDDDDTHCVKPDGDTRSYRLNCRTILYKRLLR